MAGQTFASVLDKGVDITVLLKLLFSFEETPFSLM